MAGSMPPRLKAQWKARQTLLRRYKRQVGCRWPGCAIHDPTRLEFHAPDGHEVRRVGHMLLLPIEKIKAELRRCTVLCKPHHDIITDCEKYDKPQPLQALRAEAWRCLGGPQ